MSVSQGVHLQDLLERAQSMYMTTVRKEHDDIMDATANDDFVSPVSHRQMRMASQLVQSQPQNPEGAFSKPSLWLSFALD